LKFYGKILIHLPTKIVFVIFLVKGSSYVTIIQKSFSRKISTPMKENRIPTKIYEKDNLKISANDSAPNSG